MTTILVIAHPALLKDVGITLASVVVLLLAFLGLYALRVRVVIDGENVSWRGLFGGRRFRRSEIANWEYQDLAVIAAPDPTLILLDRAGHELLRLHTVFWSRDSLRAIGRALGIPTLDVPGA